MLLLPQLAWVTGGNSGALGKHYAGSMSSWRWLLGNHKITSSSAIECLVISLSVLQSWWWWRIQAPFLWHICRALARVMRNPQDMQTPWCTTIKQSSSPLFEIAWTIPTWTFSSTCAYPSLEIHAQYAGDGVLRRDEAPCDSVAVALEVQDRFWRKHLIDFNWWLSRHGTAHNSTMICNFLIKFGDCKICWNPAILVILGVMCSHSAPGPCTDWHEAQATHARQVLYMILSEMSLGISILVLLCCYSTLPTVPASALKRK